MLFEADTGPWWDGMETGARDWELILGCQVERDACSGKELGGLTHPVPRRIGRVKVRIWDRTSTK